MKTPTGYVALRTGRHNIRNCIFLNWLDAEQFITDFDCAEYSVLDSLQDAEKYIIDDTSSLDTDKYTLNDNIAKTVTETRIANAASPPPLGPATIDDICIDDGIEIENPSETNQRPRIEWKTGISTIINRDSAVVDTTTTTHGRLPVAQPTINQNENSGHHTNITEKTKTATTHASQTLSMSQTPVHVPFIATSANDKRTNNNNTICNDKMWKESYDKYVSYKNPNNGTFPQPIPDSNVQVWLHLQGIEYGKKLQCLPNFLSNEKEEMLHSAGIVFFIHESVHEQALSLVRKQQQQKLSSPGGEAGNVQHQKQQQQHCNNGGCSLSALSSPNFFGKEQQNQPQHNSRPSSALSVRKQPLLSPLVASQEKQKQHQKQLRCNVGKSSTTPASSRPQKKAKIMYQQPIQQVWKDNLAKLKLYMDTHDGDWNVTDNDDAFLRSWILSQKDEYRLMKEGKESTFSEQKLALLHNIEVDFDKKVYSWSDRIEQLIQYKKDNGHLDVPCTHPILGRWVYNMIQEYEQMCNGMPVKVLNSEKIQKLRFAGVADFFNKIEEEKQLIWDGKFEIMFQKLKQYKEKHGSSCVCSIKNEYQDLYKWYCKVLVEYRKSLGMENAVTCLLSPRQIDRLKELGFDFTPPTQLKKGVIMPFDERIKQMKEFQRNGGDISKLTVYDTKFGSFIHRQKREYLLWRQGRPSKLNEKKIKVLESLGVQWDDVEKCVDPNDLGLTSGKKSWNERFQQLLEYKAKHGHLIVPQKTKDCLGIWVKDQRRCYRLMKQGKKSKGSMTEERAKKLADIGFVFDASTGFKQRNRKKKNKNKETTTMETS